MDTLSESTKQVPETLNRRKTMTTEQEVNRAEIEWGRIPSRDWRQDTVGPILANLSDAALRRVLVDHMKFGGIFRAGRQIADWAWAELSKRRP